MGKKCAHVVYQTAELARTAVGLDGTPMLGLSMQVSKFGADEGSASMRSGRSHPNTVSSRSDVLVASSSSQDVGSTAIPSEDISRTVHVGQIGSSVSADELTSFFSQCGEVKFVKFSGDPTSRVAFVEFDTRGGAERALLKNGVMFNGRPIIVRPSRNVSGKQTGGSGGEQSVKSKLKMFLGNIEKELTGGVQPEEKRQRTREKSRERYHSERSRRKSRSSSRDHDNSSSRHKRRRSRRSRSSSRTRHRSDSRSRRRMYRRG